MGSLDFLKKLYNSFDSAVIICNMENTLYWSKNLNLLDISDDDVFDRKIVRFHDGLMPVEHASGNYVATIDGQCYPYNVKTYSDSNKSLINHKGFSWVRLETSVAHKLNCR